MSVFHRVAASLLCTMLACGVAQAQEKAKPPAQPTYVVAMVGEALQVMTKAEFDAKKKSVDEENKKAHDQWEKEKKAAEEAKKKFETPAPKMHVVEMKSGELANKAEAEAAMAKLQKEAEAKKGPPKKGK